MSFAMPAVQLRFFVYTLTDRATAPVKLINNKMSAVFTFRPEMEFMKVQFRWGFWA
jgi:hypothetical protein